ncbi:MAG: mechanosensitive ion channel family protein [Anaerolineae bacterium]|nr:mechanosensitive ion channel family protein [Candidatus Roseilinea sp.]MDW8448917.1 mechanosensitive ion channel family protein [Anaerolineae bacterium]
MQALEFLSEQIVALLARVIVPLALTAIALVASLRLIGIVSRTAEQRIRSIYAEDYDRRTRLLTLHRTAVNTARAVVFTIAVLVVLAAIGLDLGPVLAAAGIAGLALSLGAQTLIKDFLGGIIILLEDQYRVGDVISVGGVSGTVEKITLRRTDIRDAEGRLHIVSNGDIRTLSNETRGWSRAMVELNLDFDADVEKAVAVLKDAMARAANDPDIAQDLLEQPEIFGWNSFTDWSVIVRLWAKVEPGAQWKVARVLRRYALQALKDAGIPIANRARLTA